MIAPDHEQDLQTILNFRMQALKVARALTNTKDLEFCGKGPVAVVGVGVAIMLIQLAEFETDGADVTVEERDEFLRARVEFYMNEASAAMGTESDIIERGG